MKKKGFFAAPAFKSFVGRFFSEKVEKCVVYFSLMSLPCISVGKKTK